MFRALICPSLGVCNYIVELTHWPFRSWFAVFVGVWVQFGWGGVQVPPQPNRTQTPTHTQQTKNETANVVVQQYSHILLKMGILMPETC